MALEDMTREDQGRSDHDDRSSPVPSDDNEIESSAPRPYLTHEQAAERIRNRREPAEFDRWRHVPTLELHYYPRGIEPENLSDYVRYLP